MAIITANKKKLHGAISLDELIIYSVGTPDQLLITEIHVCFNFIASIAPPTSQVYTKLTVLSLICNCINEIPVLEFSPNLIELYLNNNNLAKLENLNKVPKLEILSLSSNRIVTLENISELKSLKKLILSNNRISTINFSTLPDCFFNLTHLGILDNKITSFCDVEKLLAILPNLIQFSIGLNPFTENNLLSTPYFLTNLRITRSSLFTPLTSGKEHLNENERMLQIRQQILTICTKLKYLDLSPISS